MPIPLDRKFLVITVRHMEGSCLTILPAVDLVRYLVRRRLQQGVAVYIKSYVFDSLPPTSCANVLQRQAVVKAIEAWSLDNFKKVLPIVGNDKDNSRTPISILQHFN